MKWRLVVGMIDELMGLGINPPPIPRDGTSRDIAPGEFVSTARLSVARASRPRRHALPLMMRSFIISNCSSLSAPA